MLFPVRCFSSCSSRWSCWCIICPCGGGGRGRTCFCCWPPWASMPGEPWFVLVMLGSILANYGFGLWVDACKRAGRTCAPPLVTALAVNLGILFVFKYLTFTLGILNRLGAAFVIPGIELPIGISFFTFQALSYVLDVHRDRGRCSAR